MTRRRTTIISLFALLGLISSCSTEEVTWWFRIRGAEITQTQAIEIANKINADADPNACDEWYQGACVPDNVLDVDCEGGSGDGPAYVKGPFGPVLWDHYGLDRDGNGIACD